MRENPSPPGRNRSGGPHPGSHPGHHNGQNRPGGTGPCPSGNAPSPLPVRSSQTVGPKGPIVLQDTILHETLETFVSSHPLSRVIHAKGYGAFGSFRTVNSMSAYTTAGFLQWTGQRISTFSRFSLAAGDRSTPDTSRNIRGFSTKFHTSEGVFDLLANHIPVFLIRDAMMFPAAIRSLSPSPVNGIHDPTRFWRFVAQNPETLHFVTWLYSDLGTIDNLRAMRSYGVNTYVWKNSQGERRLVKYHWIPTLTPCPLTRQEAMRLAGVSPDIAGQDLFDTIAHGKSVEYELHVQLMDMEEASRISFDPLDATKVWSEESYPLQLVGRLTLDKNPDNYLEQVEKSAFSPANLVEGIEFSNDKLLGGRSTIYWDAQRRRIGPHFRELPINGQKHWAPSDLSSSGIGEEACGVQNRTELPWPDNFSQAGERYRSLSDIQQEHLADNIACELCKAPQSVQQKVLDHFYQCDPQLSDAIRDQMKWYRF